MRRSENKSYRARQMWTGAARSRCRFCRRSRRRMVPRARPVAQRVPTECYGTTWQAGRSASTPCHAIGAATRPCGPSASSSPPVPSNWQPFSIQRRAEHRRRCRAGRGRRRRARCSSSLLERQPDVSGPFPLPFLLRSPQRQWRGVCCQAGALSVWIRSGWDEERWLFSFMSVFINDQTFVFPSDSPLRVKRVSAILALASR